MVTITPAEGVVLPAASCAVAVSAYVPFTTPRESHESWYFVGDDSTVTSDPMFCPFTWNWTPTTSRSSTAVATRVTVPVRVALPSMPGENSETIGGATSGNGFGWAAFHC